MAAEQRLQTKVIKLCKGHGIICLKFESPSTRGVPDLILMYGGKVVFMELKSPTGRLSKLQKSQIKAIRAACVPVYVVDNFEMAQTIIRGLLYERGRSDSGTGGGGQSAV